MYTVDIRVYFPFTCMSWAIICFTQEFPNELVTCQIVTQLIHVLRHFDSGDWGNALTVLEQFFEIMTEVWQAWVAFDVADQTHAKIILEKFAGAWTLYKKMHDAESVVNAHEQQPNSLCSLEVSSFVQGGKVIFIFNATVVSNCSTLNDINVVINAVMMFVNS